jgi:hypothetical protein
LTIQPNFAAGDRVQIQTQRTTSPRIQAIGTVVHTQCGNTLYYIVQFDDRATPLLFAADELVPAVETPVL